MMTIDEYIAKMKRADKIDEFDYSKLSENMSAIMKYVMSYFNEYITLDSCDTETIKAKHAADKLEEETANCYPQSKDFILNFYLHNKIRIHKEIDKWIRDIPYFPFFYSDEDFVSLSDGFCSSYKLKGVDMSQYQGDITVLMAEMKRAQTDEPRPSEMIHLDNNIVSWVRDTYRRFGVNLYAFASDLAFSYYERYVKYERDSWNSCYHVNYYNHRYNSNPFDIDRIYDDNKHRPFLENKRCELEMLIMHEWLFEDVHDDDYWPEYVNLCISHGRTTIVNNVNALIPVACTGLNYPDDIHCTTEHIVSLDGTMKQTPQGPYILTVGPTQTRSDIWQSTDEMGVLITALHNSFKENGVPKILEILAPAKEVSFSDDKFFTCCSLLEKKMKKYSSMKVAIVNGAGNQKSKSVSYICSIEDIIKFKTQLRERKIHLQLSIDFPALLASKRNTTYNHNEILGALTEIKNSIVCLHISSVKPQTRDYAKSVTVSNDTDAYFINKYKYPVYDDFYTVLSAVFNDNQKRFFIPKNISSDIELENLIDNLLRSGFSFCDGGLQDE